MYSAACHVCVCTVVCVCSIVPAVIIWGLLTVAGSRVEDMHREEIIERIRANRFVIITSNRFTIEMSINVLYVLRASILSVF